MPSRPQHTVPAALPALQLRTWLQPQPQPSERPQLIAGTAAAAALQLLPELWHPAGIAKNVGDEHLYRPDGLT